MTQPEIDVEEEAENVHGDMRLEYDRHVELEQRFNEENEQEMDLSSFVQLESQLHEFQKRIKKYPDQILRYNTEKGNENSALPIWPYKSNIPDEFEIPPCEICKEKRVFEFQILPQILFYLISPQELKQSNSIDFSIITCFTCSRDCTLNEGNSPYIKEFVWIQKTPKFERN